MDPRIGEREDEGRLARNVALIALMTGAMHLVAGDQSLFVSLLFSVGGLVVWCATVAEHHRHGLSPIEAWALRPRARLAHMPAWIWLPVTAISAVGCAIGIAHRASWGVPLAAAAVVSSQFLAWHLIVARHERADRPTPVA